MFKRTATTAQITQINDYLVRVTGGTAGNPTIPANEFIDVLVRYYGNYEIFAEVGENDIETPAGWAAYFTDAFGSGYALKSVFSTLANQILPVLGYGKIITKEGETSKEGNTDTTRNMTTTDTGTIGDSGTSSATNTTDVTTTATPSGTVEIRHTGTDSTTGTHSLGAWDDSSYKGESTDAGGVTYNNTTTETDGKTITTRTLGNAGSTTGTNSNTRTLNTSRSDSGTNDIDFDEQGEYSETVTETGGQSPETIIGAINTADMMTLVKWLCREFVFAFCYTGVAYYDC